MLVTGNLESDDIYIVPLWVHLAQISELMMIWHWTEGSGQSSAGLSCCI